MARLLPLLTSILSLDVGMFVQRTRRNVLLFAIMALFLLTAYGAGVAALAMWLASSMSPVAALGIVAALSLSVALIVLVIVLIQNRVDERRRREAAANNRALLMTTAVSLLPVMMKSRPLMAAAVTGGLALFALRMMGGSSPEDGSPET
ncbi:hypothetical protein [Rhizobium straminoryzae]|uniref:Phage holin family protein n=1 Tax=Rhizobium straminoryzae TaxID=1387186 RepID=A0A549SZC3_9HYPH|nr:hypothetical protein [Rhizobium straminoryzae]TRL34957.1 hypothetical protein FNA46_21265 [Rhizobium straminoryzae]